MFCKTSWELLCWDTKELILMSVSGSSDLNSAKNVWNNFGRCFGECNCPSRNIIVLKSLNTLCQNYFFLFSKWTEQNAGKSFRFILIQLLELMLRVLLSISKWVDIHFIQWYRSFSSKCDFCHMQNFASTHLLVHIAPLSIDKSLQYFCGNFLEVSGGRNFGLCFKKIFTNWPTFVGLCV